MAEPLTTAFRVEGLETVKAGFAEVERSARKTGAAIAGTSQQAAESTTKLSGSFATARTVVGSFASALSGGAAIASMFAGQNQELQRSLEVVSLSLSAAGTSARTVMAVFRGLIGIVSLKVVVIAALAAGVVALIRNWDSALATGQRLWQSFANFLGRVWGGLVETGKGIGEILAGIFEMDPERIQRGVQQFKGGLGQLRSIAVDVGGQLVGIAQNLWGRALDLFGKKAEEHKDVLSPIVKGLERWRTEQLAVVETIGNTTARLATQRAVLQEYITRLQEIPKHVKLSADEQQRLQSITDDTITQIRVLNIQLANQDDAYSKLVRKQFELQRAMERQPELSDALMAAYRQETGAAAEAKAIADALAASYKRLQADVDAYRASLEDAAQSQREWDRQLEFDRRQMGEVETRLQRDITAHRRRLDLMDEGVAKRRAERDSLREVTSAIQAEIAALNEEIGAKIAAGLPVDELIKGRDRLTDLLVQMQHEFALSGRALSQALAAPMLEIMETVKRTFEGFFSDVLTGAKSFGDALVGFFGSIVNSIITAFARLAASKIVTWLFGMLFPASGGPLGFPTATLASGGIVPGHLTPIVAAQAGMMVNRPTLALVGEGGEREAIVPEHLWPAFSAGRGSGGGPRELVTNVFVVFDPRQIPRTGPDEINATVLVNLQTNGVIARQIRQMIPR